VDGLSRNDAGGFELDSALLVGVNWTKIIDSYSQGVNHTAEECFADWNVHDSSSSFHNVTFLNLSKDTVRMDALTYRCQE
jgi:hypothetical protein